MKRDAGVPDFVYDYPNLASPRMGTLAVTASDEFFAPKERMLSDRPAVFIPDKYDANGKWMDGWETRRRRGEGNDWCVLKLGVAGVVKGVEIDTSHFTGNYPPAASLQGALGADIPQDESAWFPLIATTPLGPDRRHYLEVSERAEINWLRLQIFPDGGIARLRVYGIARPSWTAAERASEVELSALKSGGRIVAYNDAHYGDVSALLSEDRGRDMGDGWETRRRREPGNDWIIVALGAPGTVSHIEVDTAHYKGNYPDRCSLQAAHIEEGATQSLVTQSMFWSELLPSQKLSADRVHTFGRDLVAPLGIVSHVRLNIFPDGGVSRLRLFGRLA
jgi:allantoicase